jgi:nucleotide-binding universal stress UspA family protein
MLSRRATDRPRLPLQGASVALTFAESAPSSFNQRSRVPSQRAAALADAASERAPEKPRRGTIVCGISDIGGADAAVDVAVELRARLDLRLVLVAIGDGILDESGQPVESITTNAAREGARRMLERLLYENAPNADVECRLEVGDRATQLARVAHEEEADLVVVGSTRSRLFPGRVRVDELDELRMASPCPVVVVPSRPR